jgi:hypothetical protein
VRTSDRYVYTRTHLHDRSENVDQVVIAVSNNSLCNEDEGADGHEYRVKCKQFQGTQLCKYCDHDSGRSEDYLLHVVINCMTHTEPEAERVNGGGGCIVQKRGWLVQVRRIRSIPSL